MSKKIIAKSGGQLQPERPGHFHPEKGGQFHPEKAGVLIRNIQLEAKINLIAKYVNEQQSIVIENSDETWVDNYDVCTFLKISERTLQRLRSKGLVSYSVISGKSYYTITEVKRMLTQHIIRSNEECLADLINNHKESTERRKVNKGAK